MTDANGADDRARSDRSDTGDRHERRGVECSDDKCTDERRVDRRLRGAQRRPRGAAAGDQRLRSRDDRAHQAQPRRRGLLGAHQRIRLARLGPDDGFGDDCTDFVSRALAIGGGDPETVLSDRSTSNDHYWYFSTFRYGRWWSHSWSVAEDLAVHLNLLHSTWLRY